MAAPPAYAQFDLIFGVDLALELTPAHPAPGERLHARARSSLLDLSETQLRWSANGKPIAEGIGVTEVDVTAGALGSETQLTVTALENALEFSSAEATIAPVELDLLWEADSYVPPFYRGRALPSAGTNLRLEAIPRFVRSGSSVPLRDIIFTWKRDGYVIAAASGRGKSKATVESPPLFASETISVEAKTSDGRLQGVASARISSQEPHVALYENDPVFGIAYHRALARENQIPEIETTFAAVPYFAEAASPDDTALIYNWRVNDIGIANDPEHPSGLTINASGSSGSALIELLLKHATNLFINAPGSWLVNFQSAGAQAPFVGSE
ncbi:hypothetical protein HYW60_01765 [Candidatus Kaiserbacteria bacterium]|nr:hypothetical protein [Candidatus Kaiserbacteria bacterium]